MRSVMPEPRFSLIDEYAEYDASVFVPLEMLQFFCYWSLSIRLFIVLEAQNLDNQGPTLRYLRGSTPKDPALAYDEEWW
jgi:hypothetical protein